MTTSLKWRCYILSILASLILFSCQKMLTDESGTSPATSVDLTTRVTSSVSGFVTDENDMPVPSALVKAGSKTITTDEYGYFEVRNEPLIKNAATVTVTMPGYFPGIRTFIAAQNRSSFVRIKLLRKITAGVISGSAGGFIILSNGLKVTLPVNGVVNASTGAAYSGVVNVAASWIDPTAADCDRNMPGDLRALDLAGNFKQLTTFGMAAVELTGSAGETLQMATGKKATLTFPLPASLAASAPASIPLWYFDEATGLWKEEGTAVKTGSSYEGDVSHFSFWNCDVPADFVQVSMTVKDNDGNPVPYAYVKISRVTNPNSSATGYTDSTGYVGGAIPANAQLKLEVFTNYSCAAAVHTQTFSSTNTTSNLGTITINTSQGTAVVAGTATTCNNTPVANGFVIMKKGNEFYRFAVGAGGAFQFTTLLCNNTPASVELIAEDLTAGQQSQSISRNITVGSNAVGVLQACGVTTQQFVNLTINTTNYNYSAPIDSLTLFRDQGPVSNPGFSLTALRMQSPFLSTSFGWTGGNIAAGSTQTLTMFWTQEISDSTVQISPISVNISEYGSVGQFVAGNFTGSLKGAAPANILYNVTCSFRVRRYF